MRISSAQEAAETGVSYNIIPHIAFLPYLPCLLSMPLDTTVHLSLTMISAITRCLVEHHELKTLKTSPSPSPPVNAEGIATLYLAHPMSTASEYYINVFLHGFPLSVSFLLLSHRLHYSTTTCQPILSIRSG